MTIPRFDGVARRRALSVLALLMLITVGCSDGGIGRRRRATDPAPEPEELHR